MLVSSSTGQLTASFYDVSCPADAQATVKKVIRQALQTDSRIGASLLRLHFHDCFVNGCDGSILLDDTSSFTGDKTAPPNLNSARGFDVVDTIKTQLESACNGTVSCADILAIAARDAVVLDGGPSWTVQLGRRDSTTASFNTAKNDIPSPALTGLYTQDMVTLSGAHTIGQARCSSFSGRLYNFSGTGKPDTIIDKTFLANLQQQCPQGGNANQLQPLDLGTPRSFDNQYYRNLQANKGLLNSDEVLYSTSGTTNSLVVSYAGNQNTFFDSFQSAMIKLANISPLTGTSGQIRENRRVVNS
ncbi:hypothetical protein O6H91_12G025500 [Diphasiastrum complanatum]|uniref:Uncharacterized protein n=2 Tax=Diphasiastrum complanatum TaxID=34168 RepID=A0ACC2BZP5_DIPCM|nr:hypothetical protein O6H91_12G025200 [Diphasiastrum complanatum]KAJ7535262.1 hypothetical protein O6H91_12G025500 [Diphasiastrum complanatum]